MKKLLLIIPLLFIATISFAQSGSEMFGMWKSYVKASGLKGNSIPTYMVLNPDGTYIWGIDSAASDPMKSSSRGSWSLTNEGEIKFIPSDTSSEIRYYKPSGNNSFQYKYTEKDGKKIPVYMLEMDFYIEKILPDTKE